jgi:hypothetical protein
VTSYRLMDGVAGRPGVGSSGTQPPASTTALSGPYVVGTCFKVTTACWLQGYWWWVAPSGGTTAAQKFCLWSANIDGSASNRGSVIPAATITSGTLAVGFNYVPLAVPVPLTIGWTYLVTTGWASGSSIPYTANQFGSGKPYSAGIVNGPLTGFSDLGAGNVDPFGNLQCGYDRTAGDPAVNFPTTDDAGGFNGWIDPQVTDTPPANATYRLFPSLEGWQTGPGVDYNETNDPSGYTIGNTFSLSRSCNLLKLWFLSGSGGTALPTRCAVWDVLTQTEIAGTDNPSPSWLTETGSAASPGNGWVYCDYSGSGIVLPAGRNMIAAAYSATATLWRFYCLPFWGTGGISGGPALNLGANGLNYGVISAPSTAGGVPLQGGYYGPNLGWGFPGLWNNPENDWTDIEVSPVPVPNVPPYTATMASM